MLYKMRKVFTVNEEKVSKLWPYTDIVLKNYIPNAFAFSFLLLMAILFLTDYKSGGL